MLLSRRRFPTAPWVLLLAVILLLPTSPGSCGASPTPLPTSNRVTVAPVEYVNLTDLASNWTSDFSSVTWPMAPFSAVQVQLTLTNYGDPWDRADWIDLNNVTLLDVTTLENGSDNNHVQAFSVNITEYESLFAGPGHVWWQAMPNWISPCDAGVLGCWTGVLSFRFTTGPAPLGLPTIVPVLPFATLTATSPWVNGTLHVPGAYARAQAVIFQEGQGNDEFWYAQPFASRELEWSWDNRTVLAVIPLPFINSGGALGGTDDLYEWNGTPAPGTGARPAVDVDLTPWLGVLNDSPWYNFTVLDNDNSWQIGLALFLWAASDSRTFAGDGSEVVGSLGARTGIVQGNAFANYSEPFALESYNLSWAEYLNVSTAGYDVASTSTAVDRISSTSVTLERTALFRMSFDVRVDGSGAVHVAFFANWTNSTSVRGNGQDANLTEQESTVWTIDGSSGGLASTQAKAAVGSSVGTYSAPSASFSDHWGRFQNRSSSHGVGTDAAPSSVRFGGSPLPLPGRFLVAPASGATADGAVPVDLLTTPGSVGPALVYLGNESWTVSADDTVVANEPSLRNGTYSLDISAPTADGVTPLQIPLTVTGWTPPYVAPLVAIASAPAELGEAPWPVAFTGSADGGVPPYHWLWTFGDGARSFVQNATHVYNAEGNLAANLTVTDADDRTGQSSINLFVFAPLTLALRSAPSEWTEGLPEMVTANISGGDGPFHYSWAQPSSDCSASSGPILSCTPARIGITSVNLTVTDALGYTATAWFNTSVTAPTEAGAASAPSPLLIGGTAAVAALCVAVLLIWRRGARGRTPR